MKCPTEPCKSCPYRKDSPRRLWDPEEFRNLLRQDANEMGGALFLCHRYRNLPPEQRSQEAELCAGWALDQRARGYPAIQLRLHMMSDRELVDSIEAAHPPAGVELFPSIAAMCRANGVRPPRRR